MCVRVSSVCRCYCFVIIIEALVVGNIYPQFDFILFVFLFHVLHEKCAVLMYTIGFDIFFSSLSLRTGHANKPGHLPSQPNKAAAILAFDYFLKS